MNIIDIIDKSTTSGNERNKQRFLKAFQELYRIDLFKPALDFILTKANKGETTFEVRLMEQWDRVSGHCESHVSSAHDKTGIFRKKFLHKICIKAILPEIIMHEIAHATEIESGLNLKTSGFYEAFKKDIIQKSSFPTIANAVRQIITREIGFCAEEMSEAGRKFIKGEIKLYEDKQIISELFARYYELIAMSQEAGWFHQEFQYHLQEIINYFQNTTHWITTILNPKLIASSDMEISKASMDLINNLPPLEKPKFTENIYSVFDKKPVREDSHNAVGDRKWTGITDSTDDWQRSFDKVMGNSKNPDMVSLEDAKKLQENYDNLTGTGAKASKAILLPEKSPDAKIKGNNIILLGDDSEK